MCVLPARWCSFEKGTTRVAGRDFSSLETAACYQQGEISCLSCHSTNGCESPDDQLAVDMRSDAACLQCHERISENISAQTHHGEQSVGSRCMNCHMPHKSCGLFKAIRSHRIDSPTTGMTLDHGRPNACVLCHVDRTTPWIDARLVWSRKGKSQRNGGGTFFRGRVSDQRRRSSASDPCLEFRS